MTGASEQRTELGRDLEDALIELAAHLRGEVEAESYEVSAAAMTPERVRTIRRKVAASTKEFERQFHISARTMEAYEQGAPTPGPGDAGAPDGHR